VCGSLIPLTRHVNLSQSHGPVRPRAEERCPQAAAQTRHFKRPQWLPLGLLPLGHWLAAPQGHQQGRRRCAPLRKQQRGSNTIEDIGPTSGGMPPHLATDWVRSGHPPSCRPALQQQWQLQMWTLKQTGAGARRPSYLLLWALGTPGSRLRWRLPCVCNQAHPDAVEECSLPHMYMHAHVQCQQHTHLSQMHTHTFNANRHARTHLRSTEATFFSSLANHPG